MDEKITIFGFMLVFLGIIIVIISSLLGEKNVKTSFAFGGFIGPVPFGFANNKNMLVAVMLLSLIVLAAFIFLNMRL